MGSHITFSYKVYVCFKQALSIVSVYLGSHTLEINLITLKRAHNFVTYFAVYNAHFLPKFFREK